MPRYDYACADAATDSRRCSPSRPSRLDTCPECGGAIRRVIGAVGVAFKGSGFYRTDSRASAKSGRFRPRRHPRDHARGHARVKDAPRGLDRPRPRQRHQCGGTSRRISSSLLVDRRLAPPYVAVIERAARKQRVPCRGGSSAACADRGGRAAARDRLRFRLRLPLRFRLRFRRGRRAPNGRARGGSPPSPPPGR